MKNMLVASFVMVSFSALANPCLDRPGKNEICVNDKVFYESYGDYYPLDVLELYTDGSAKVHKPGTYSWAAYETDVNNLLKSRTCVESSVGKICDGKIALVKTEYGMKATKIKGVFQETETIAYTKTGNHEWVIEKASFSDVIPTQVGSLGRIKVGSNVSINSGDRKGLEAKVRYLFEGGHLVLEMNGNYYNGFWYHPIGEVKLKEKL